MDRLRVGVIGCGLIAQVMHLPHLRELDDRFEIAALCDLSRQVLDALGAYYGVTRRVTDWRELVALPDVDAVLVCTTGSHAPQAIAAAEAGKHVLVEKPMCLTLREADAMIAAAERTGVTLMVAYMKRYDPGYATPARSCMDYVTCATCRSPCCTRPSRLDCVTGRTQPETDGHVGRRDIAVALDIYDAYARRVGLPVARRS
jgi:Oxidoreductase family, NAD-binding Rossmann fold